jgi:hypothetical protein
MFKYKMLGLKYVIDMCAVLQHRHPAHHQMGHRVVYPTLQLMVPMIVYVHNHFKLVMNYFVLKYDNLFKQKTKKLLHFIQMNDTTVADQHSAKFLSPNDHNRRRSGSDGSHRLKSNVRVNDLHYSLLYL